MRDFSKERLAVHPEAEDAGFDGKSSAWILDGDGRLAAEAYGEIDAEAVEFGQQIAARWNACADALARGETLKVGDSPMQTLQDVLAILRKAVHAS